MTRLEKNAVRWLIVLGITIAAVAVLYITTHDFWQATTGFALMAIIWIVRNIKNSGNKDLDKRNNEWKKSKNKFFFSVISAVAVLVFVEWTLSHFFQSNEMAVWTSKIFPVVWIIMCIFFLGWKYKMSKKGLSLFDEREEKVVKDSMLVAFRTFWELLIIFNIMIGVIAFDKHIPGRLLITQTLLVVWISLCVFNVAVLLKERKIGYENS